MSIDCGPLALPATLRGTTEQHEDTTEQHKHHFLDPSCRICMGGRETQEGHRVVGRLGLSVGFSGNRDSWLGEKVVGRGYLCSRSPQKGPGSNSVSNALGWL